jgi:hypothetical protein
VVGWFGWARVSRGACVCVVFEASSAVWRRQLSLCGAPPQGVVPCHSMILGVKT